MNFHTTSRIVVNSAMFGVSMNPTGSSARPSAIRIRLNTPSWSLMSTNHISAAAAVPTTYGRKYAVR
jgi:hypothetical protein